MSDLIDSGNANLLIIDDDVTVIQILGKTLNGLGRVRYATNGADAIALALREPPDLVLLDAEMPGMSGFEVLKAMREQSALEHVPVIFVTSHNSQEMEEEGLARGAADFIGKAIRPAIVAARVKTQLRLKRAVDRLRTLSSLDALTGLANRRTLDEVLLTECRRAQRARSPVSVLMVDVDHFKRYNDTYGHGPGDTVLIAIAKAMQACTSRPADLVARYGGEEFAVVLPDTDGAGAMKVAHTLLEHVMGLQIPHSGAESGILSLSIGIAAFDKDCPHWADEVVDRRDRANASPEVCSTALLATADQALYAAKHGGRARAILNRFEGYMPSAAAD